MKIWKNQKTTYFKDKWKIKIRKRGSRTIFFLVFPICRLNAYGVIIKIKSFCSNIQKYLNQVDLHQNNSSIRVFLATMCFIWQQSICCFQHFSKWKISDVGKIVSFVLHREIYQIQCSNVVDRCQLLKSCFNSVEEFNGMIERSKRKWISTVQYVHHINGN